MCRDRKHGGRDCALEVRLEFEKIQSMTQGLSSILDPRRRCDFGDKMDSSLMSIVRIGASVAFCGFTTEGLMVTATAKNLIQVWQVQSNSSDNSEIVCPPLAVFPTSARMGSPDGVGGQVMK